jgi:glutamine synthetase
MPLQLPVNLKFEYIWLDGYAPEPNLRSKTKVIRHCLVSGKQLSVEDLPIWFFDGSSTLQAEGNYSDCALKPVKMIPDPQRTHAYLVLCEVMEPDGITPHQSNTRALIPDGSDDYWFGFEQEYIFINPDTLRPLGFPKEGFPAPQGMYYCGVGHKAVEGRNIVESHLDTCLNAGLEVTGINAEVLLGQWEFQVLGKGAKNAADDLWLCRYLLYRESENHNVTLEFHPKPIKGDWNGSGLHANFSNERMREEGGKEYFEFIFSVFKANHEAHIKEYGSSNDQRLTGKHETANINQFKYGVSDRGASVRIPQTTAVEWKGYLEDRRPASNADPYRIVARIVKTMQELD